MDLLPTLLPLLGSSRAGGLVLPAAVAYLPAGIFYLAMTGIGDVPPRRSRPTGGATFTAALGIWTVSPFVWPLLLAARTLHLLRRRATVGAPCRIRPIPPALADAAPAPLPQKPTIPPVPPRWYRQDYAAVGVALTEGRLTIARTWAGCLADDATSEFGPAHPYTQEAWLLVARTVRTALGEIHDAQPADDAQPIDDPYGYFLFPHAHRGAWDPDRDSVYISSLGQQAVAR
ncbi:hypothetical protein ACFRKE_00620 [Kitasatospora indigofera]|uniref:hypothetical protein n=1 Tax=Kitasatospora indigofera TaxID=67307 RepID=UPI00367D7FDD